MFAVWKARYMRLLGLLQHTPSEKHWEAGRLLPGQSGNLVKKFASNRLSMN